MTAGTPAADSVAVSKHKLSTFPQRQQLWISSQLSICLQVHYKEECVAKLILFGERSLKRALHHYELHYHGQRNHQGKGNLLLFPSSTLPLNPNQGKVRCRERLGGLLKYYERA